MGRAGGPQPWSTTRKIGRAIGTGERGRARAAAQGLRAKGLELEGRVALRLCFSHSISVSQSRVSSATPLLGLLNIPFSYFLGKGTLVTPCVVIVIQVPLKWVLYAP